MGRMTSMDGTITEYTGTGVINDYTYKGYGVTSRGRVRHCARGADRLGQDRLLAGGKARCHADAIRAQKVMLQ